MSEPSLSERKTAFVKLGLFFRSILNSSQTDNSGNSEFEDLLLKAKQKNPWFTVDNVKLAFSAWVDVLTEDQLNQWLRPYDEKLNQHHAPKTIGVINAGNIPLVGFHDLLSVVLSGNRYLGKNASDDPYLLPFVAQKLQEIEPKLKGWIFFTEKLTGFDAVIATGSNNSARYFDYYFGKYPHVIRMNRNAVAVLTGKESDDDFKNLGRDIFQYFGLGCRNVSKLFVPRGYSFNRFFETIESFSSLMLHNKYMNNHDYNNAIYLLKKIPFLDNNFFILKEDSGIASPISVVYYEFYDELKIVEEKLIAEKENIQCIASAAILSKGAGPLIKFGETQCPKLWDYADGVDTIKFLTEH